MPRTTDATFQKREGILNSICMDVSNHINFFTVVNSLVHGWIDACFLHGRWIRGEIIGHQNVKLFCDVIIDEFRQGSRLHIICMKVPKFTAALPESYDDFFGVSCLGHRDVPFLPTDVGLVHFDGAAHHVRVNFLHRGTDAMTEIPSRLIADTKCPLNLTSRNAFLRFTEQQRNNEPLYERKVGIIKNRACGYGKLVVAFLAVEELFFSFKFNGLSSTPKALWTVWPAETDEQFTAFVFVGKEPV